MQRQTVQHDRNDRHEREGHLEHGRSAASTSADGRGHQPVMARTLAVLKGATPAQAIAKYPGSVSTTGASGGAGHLRRRRGQRPAGRRLERRHDLLHARARSSGADGMLLNYLLGN